MFAVLNSFAPAVAGTYALALAEYPETPPYNDGSYAWKKARKERLNYANEIDGDALAGFIKKTLPEFLKTENGENGVYSPLNVYMVLAMMAESAKGNSRKQILDLLCMESIEDLRTNAHALWSLNYINMLSYGKCGVYRRKRRRRYCVLFKRRRASVNRL
jgi:hypothetical protein